MDHHICTTLGRGKILVDFMNLNNSLLTKNTNDQMTYFSTAKTRPVKHASPTDIGFYQYIFYTCKKETRKMISENGEKKKYVLTEMVKNKQKVHCLQKLE